MRSPTRVPLAVALAALLVLAGCASPSAPATTGEDGTTDRSPTTTAPTETTAPGTTGTTTTDGTTGGGTTTAADVSPSDPDEDRIGWEAGYWYNETVSVTPDDGYDEEELDRIVARTMARIEVIRDLEFTDGVSVEVITREEYRERNVFDFDPDPWQDQVYEALFIVGEDTHAADALEDVYGGSVAGYYASGDIVIVSDDPDSVRIDRSTLAHELVHALQDDQLNLASYGRTLDGASATRGLTEGEANYVMDRYQERCATEWECIPSQDGGSSDRSFNQGLFLTLFTPYSDGPALVGDLFERDGWAAVNRAYDRPPVSTEQLIHPEKYPGEEPIDVRVEDRSNGEWERFGPRGRNRQRVGEAGLYAMFWTNGVIPRSHLGSDDSRYNYSHPATDGWGGDAVVPYRNGDRYGYVFKTAWDTRDDAETFHEAYLELLEERGAERVSENVYVVPDEDAFDDAFRVVRNGKRVVIVNGPSEEALDEIHPRK